MVKVLVLDPTHPPMASLVAQFLAMHHQTAASHTHVIGTARDLALIPNSQIRVVGVGGTRVDRNLLQFIQDAATQGKKVIGFCGSESGAQAMHDAGCSEVVTSDHASDWAAALKRALDAK